jgi:DNA-binding transcriptional ArsR family regulator
MSEVDEIFEEVADYFSVMSEPARLKIIHAICQSERTVSEIVEVTGSTQSNISRHLGLMYRHGLLAKRREGNQIFYRMADETMIELCRTACNRIAATIDDRGPLKRQLVNLMPPAAKRKSKA